MADTNKSEPSQDGNEQIDLRSMMFEVRIQLDAVVICIDSMIQRERLPHMPELAALRRVAGQTSDIIGRICDRMQGQALLPAPIAAKLEPVRLTAIDALKFYAEETHYERRGRAASAIVQDGGSRAREALATIAGDEGDEE